MCSLSYLKSTERRIRLWSNITCVTYFLLIGLVTYRLYSFVMVSESRSPILLSIYRLPFVFVYCLVEIKLNVGCIFWTSSTELHNKLITQLIRWLIMVHDFVYLCLISVSVNFCYSSFLLKLLQSNFSIIYMKSYGRRIVNWESYLQKP